MLSSFSNQSIGKCKKIEPNLKYVQREMANAEATNLPFQSQKDNDQIAEIDTFITQSCEGPHF